MKSIVLFTVFLLSVNLSQQLPKLVNCPADFEISKSMTNSCGIFTCDGPTKISGKGCGTHRCLPGKQLRYIEPDNSKPYPECCGGPICAP